MLNIRSFINFFFVPVIAYYLLCKKHDKKLQPNFESLIIYIILVCFNIPLTRVFTFALRVLVGKNIEADSSYYTVAALISAAFMPILYDLGKKIMRNAKEKGSNNK